MSDTAAPFRATVGPQEYVMGISRRTFLETGMIAAGSSMLASTRIGSVAGAESPAPAPSVGLSLTFEGLCLFAAQRGLAPTQLGQVQALLIDSDKLTSGHFDPHSPKLSVARQQVTFDQPPDSTDDHGNVSWGLKGQDVTLLFDSRAASGTVVTEANVTRQNKAQRLALTPPYDASWRDVAFIADLDGILGGPDATVDQKYLRPDLGTDGKVTSRIMLAGGTLVGGTPKDPWGRHIWWGFNDPSPASNYRQSITDIVEFHSPQAASIAIVLTHRTTRATRTITLAAPSVAVSITNKMVDGTPVCRDSDAHCPTNHFRAYYELLATDPGHHPTLGPVFLAGSNDQLRTDSPVYCPPPLAFY
jgi:hypothetical protein